MAARRAGAQGDDAGGHAQEAIFGDIDQGDLGPGRAHHFQHGGIVEAGARAGRDGPRQHQEPRQDGDKAGGADAGRQLLQQRVHLGDGVLDPDSETLGYRSVMELYMASSFFAPTRTVARKECGALSISPGDSTSTKFCRRW